MQSWTLITGASEGLGAEFARIAAAEGRNLILTARSEDKLEALAGELRDAAGEIAILLADLNDQAQTEALWQDATDGRRIDILVNNAGLGSHDRFDDAGAWARELASIHVNLMAASYLMKRAILHMQAHGGGRIMNLSSTGGFTPGPNMAVYCATKAYVLSLSEAVAEELRGGPVTLTALCPGATRTRFQSAAGMEGSNVMKWTHVMSARDVARTGWSGMLRGKRLVVPGLMNRLIALSPRLAPRALTAFVAGKVMGKG